MNDQRDTLFKKPRRRGDFAFDAEVAAVFDDMLSRSIPFYTEQQALVRSLARAYWQPGSAVYDLGCSRATALIALAEALPECERLAGYDSSEPMLAKAAEAVSARGLGSRIAVRFADLNCGAGALDLEDAGIVTACWTLQFVRPALRPELLGHIHASLRRGGALIMCEKVTAADSAQERFFVQSYFDYKRAQGYSEQEIKQKEASLEGVLVPLTVDANIAMVREAGFSAVEVFFRWFNFAAFVCVK